VPPKSFKLFGGIFILGHTIKKATNSFKIYILGSSQPFFPVNLCTRKNSSNIYSKHLTLNK